MARQTKAKRLRPRPGRRPMAASLAHPEDGSGSRIGRYLQTMLSRTVLIKVIVVFIICWLLFSAGLYYADRGIAGSTIDSYADALYWSVAAFSTAGIADPPRSPLAQLIGGIWIVLGSVIFFGTIVATITSYFMRPVQRPVNQIIDTIEYNLERMEDLSVDELALLKKTSDALILHMERLKESGEERKT